MSASPLRGLKLGAGTALMFAIVTPINDWLRHDQISMSSIVTGSIFAFVLFGLIGTFTDKIGVDVGGD